MGRDGEPLIDWLYAGDHPSFSNTFEATLTDYLQLPFNLLFGRQTSVADLCRVADAEPGLEPSGLIFHCSRSGSLHLNRVLTRSNDTVVLYEVSPIDSLLRAKRFNSSITDEQRIKWIRSLLSSLTRSQSKNNRLFIVFHSWSIFESRIIRAAFPNARWMFVYGDPLEELVEQLGQRDAHMIPGLIDSRVFGLDPDEVQKMQPADYCARVLKATYEAALALTDDHGLFLNISQGQDCFEAISTLFGVDSTELQPNNDSERGVESIAIKRASSSIHEAAQTWVYPVYNAIEQSRLSRPLTETLCL